MSRSAEPVRRFLRLTQSPFSTESRSRSTAQKPMFTPTIRTMPAPTAATARLPAPLQAARIILNLYPLRHSTAPAHESQQDKLNQPGREAERVPLSISLTARNWDQFSKILVPVGMAKSALPQPPSLAMHLLAKHPRKPRELLMRVT